MSDPAEHSPRASRRASDTAESAPQDRDAGGGTDASTPPAPGQLVTSDPERIRALAHPLRLRLLDVLDDEGAATATRCAELTGESVASCSFHLRTLARYGFIEPAPRVGREKPWRTVGAGLQTRWDPEQPGSLRANAELARLVVEQETARIGRWLDSSRTEDEEWLLASTLTRATFWATSAELAELRAQVESLTEAFRGRQADPSLRPAGSRPAALWAVLNAEPGEDAT